MKASYRKYLKFAVFGVLAFCGVMLGNVEDAAAEEERVYFVSVATKDGEKYLCSGRIFGEPGEKGYDFTVPGCRPEGSPVNFYDENNEGLGVPKDTLRIDINGNYNSCKSTKRKQIKFDGTGVNYNSIEIDEVVNKFVGGIGSFTLACNGKEAAISAFSSQDKAQEFLDNYKPVDPEDPDPDKVEQNCGNGGGAQSLGWIVCPIMTWAGEASKGLYEKFVEPALQVEPQLFTSNNGNTLKGWETFRNIANIVFVILLLAVIFSQLTGVGINNYGVKKILPKLIVMAVLINLSYFICVALIDVSNILGNSLQALFDGLGNGLDPALTIEESDNIKDTKVSEAGATLVSLGVAGLLAGTMVGAVWGNPAIILTLLISLVGVAISIMMLFVLLAAREAAIVVLVVISPLAVICYALPNTKNLFTKWLNIFKALLILYPVAGLLVGGGNYVSSLLLTVGMGEGVFTAVTAMLAGIVPIFFIPSLTKNAFSGLGNLGAKISNIGDKARRGTTQGMTNSRFNKHMQERGAMRRDNLRAGMKKDKDGNLVPTRTGKLRNRFANTRLGNAVGYAAALGARKEQSIKKADAEQAAKDWNKEFYTHDDGAIYAKDKNGEWSYAGGGDPKKAAETLPNETVQNNLARRRQQKADAEAAGKKYNGLPAGLTSYSQGIANQNKIDRAENLGKVAANATMKDADNVARAAMRVSGVAAGEAIEDKLVAGQRDVLQVKHDKAAEQRKQVRIEGQEGYVAKSDDAIRLDIKNNNNATTGANQAVAEAKVEAGSLDKVAASVETAQLDKTDQLNAVVGKNQAVTEAIARASVGENGPLPKDQAIAKVAKSVEANRQAAESQFIDVASGNDATRFTSKSAEQIQQAVGTGSQKLQNQFETEVATNDVGVARITPDIAKSRAEASRLATERKIWEDQLSRADTNTLQTSILQAIADDNKPGVSVGDRLSASAKLGAAFEGLKNTGNLPKLFETFDKPGVWDSMSDSMRLELNQDMIKSGDVTMSTFAKENFKAGGKLDFNKFISGEPQTYNVRDSNGNLVTKTAKSFADYVIEKGSHGLDAQDKDSIEHLDDRFGDILGTVSNENRQKFTNIMAKQMISGYTATQKGEEKTKFLNLLKNYKNNLTNDEYVNAMSKAISAAGLAKMDSGIFDALGDENMQRSIIGSAWKELNDNPANATLLASMSPSLKEKLGEMDWNAQPSTHTPQFGDEGGETGQ